MATAPELGWSGVPDGLLLRLAAAEFDVLVTGDQNLRFQQDLSGLELGVVVIVAADNRVETVTRLAPQIRSAVASAQPGQTVTVP